MGRRFIAIQNFHSDDLASDYVAGLSYEAREQDQVLLKLIPTWIKEGKVREGGPSAVMSAVGEVTDKPTGG